MSISISLLENFWFKAFGEDGTVLDCEGLFILEANDSKKKYLVYTDHSISEGRENVFASIYDYGQVEDLGEVNPDSIVELDFEPIQTEEEWEIIDYALGEYDRMILECNEDDDCACPEDR